ncbi:hypothetical protein C8C76_11536 [Halanaerobium saccharolyticum]|jgi:hypothetical protein|uniref:Uncharacterized protein n=1 Tax=Halanaerobium saccharolyticum TaxID=43595 RepID=A0A2T5RJA6_9FIRM|nr:hypothetical protein [Halanaerobium saccharolyticum]PTV98630.1 hypothetical protein C8C76_11536 [Halanaerobium saccharolyticum]
MYEVFFDFNGHNSENSHKLEGLWMPAQSKPQINKFGHGLFSFVNLNLNNLEKIKEFINQWSVNKIRLINGDEYNIDKLSVKDINILRTQQEKIKRAIFLYLGDMEEIGSSIDTEYLSPEERFNIFEANIFNIPVELTTDRIFTKSDRTLRRVQKRIGEIEKEIDKIEKEITNLNSHNILYNNILFEMFEKYCDENECNQEICNEYECMERARKEKIDELNNKSNLKRQQLRELEFRGWKVITKYTVPDILTLSLLEILLAIQNNIPAKRCSLCGKIFLNYGKRNSIKRCPICGENDNTAANAYNKKKRILKKIVENEAKLERIAKEENLPINWLKKQVGSFKSNKKS